jgi:hypothetical protein
MSVLAVAFVLLVMAVATAFAVRARRSTQAPVDYTDRVHEQLERVQATLRHG